jgi:hypothetical protein
MEHVEVLKTGQKDMVVVLAKNRSHVKINRIKTAYLFLQGAFQRFICFEGDFSSTNFLYILNYIISLGPLGMQYLSKKSGTVKSLIFTWVLFSRFSRGCYDRENKTREYENI